jgi:transcriptional regulator with XRE-family HTH domain
MENKENILLGQFLKEIRLQKGLSLGDVEEKTFISRSYLSRIENSNRDNPSLQIIGRLSECLGIEFSTIAEFYKGGINIDGREIKDLSYILLNERYTFAEIEQTIEAKMILRSIIKEMEIYCTKKEVNREDGNRVMDLVDKLRAELCS